MLIYTVAKMSLMFTEEKQENQNNKFHPDKYLETDENNKVLRIYSTDLSLYTKFNPGDFYQP